MAAAPDVCRQHHPDKSIACTASVWAIIEKAVKNPKACNSVAGIVHDLLWMARVAPVTLRGMDPGVDARFFQVLIAGAGRQRKFFFKFHVGPDDNGQPCITLMMPEED